MNIYQKRPIFRRRNKSSVYRMFLWVVLILGAIWLIRSVQVGDVKPLFQPTATPTRFALSYANEGDALFTAGRLKNSKNEDGTVTSPGAITAFRQAAEVDPNNAKVWADLARIQTYSTALLVNQDAILVRLDEAVASAEKAVEVNPDDSYAHAVHAFSLNWKASYLSDNRERQKLLLANLKMKLCALCSWIIPTRSRLPFTPKYLWISKSGLRLSNTLIRRWGWTPRLWMFTVCMHMCLSSWVSTRSPLNPTTAQLPSPPT